MPGMDTQADRDHLTLLASAYLMDQDVAWLRVHDVRAHVTLQESLTL
jgi:dihydropteroate synthase